MMTMQQKLERIKRYRTLYEIALFRPGKPLMLVAYGDKSFTRVYAAASNRLDRIHLATDGAPVAVYRVNAAPHQNEPYVYATGRTHREAIIAGELPYLPRIDDNQPVVKGTPVGGAA